MIRLLILIVASFLVCHHTIFGQAGQIKSTSKANANAAILATPQGHKIQLYTRGGHYYLKWKQGNHLKTLEDGYFTMEYGHALYPKFVKENKDYIVLRSECGNPCWVGDFLPLYPGGKGRIIHEYIAIDLNGNRVASVYAKDTIAVINLRTGTKNLYRAGECESAFIGYCIDTAYFEGKELRYSWSSETLSSNKKAVHRIKIE